MITAKRTGRLSHFASRIHRYASRVDATILKNVGSLLSLQGANYIIPLITLPYLTRVLGPENYGRVGFALSLVQYFVLFTDFGFNLSATRAISICRNDKILVTQIFWNTICAKIVLAFLGFLALLTLSYTVPRLAADRGIIIISYLAVLGNILFPIWLFQGLEKMGFIAVCNTLSRIICIVPLFVFVHNQNDFAIAVILQSGANIVAGIVSLWFVSSRALVGWAVPRLPEMLHSLRESWPLFMSIAAVSLYTTTNIVILGFVAGNVAVGQFVAADKIRQAVQSVVNPISQAFYPRICSMMNDYPQRAYRAIRRLLWGQGTVTLLLSLFLFFCAGPIGNFALGSKYHGIVPILRWLAFLPFAIGVSNVFGVQTMLPLRMNLAFRNILIGSGLVNVALLFPLSSAFGAVGAAAAVMTTELIVAIAMAVTIIHRRIPIFINSAGGAS